MSNWHLSSISSALPAGFVNQTSTKQNSVLTVFIIIKDCCEVFISCPNCLFGTKINKIFDECSWSFLAKLQCTKTTSTDSNFGTISPFLSLSTTFFVLPYNLIVSGVNNSNL